MRRIGGTLVVATLLMLQPVVVADPWVAAAVHRPAGIDARQPRVVTDKHGDDDPSPEAVRDTPGMVAAAAAMPSPWRSQAPSRPGHSSSVSSTTMASAHRRSRSTLASR